MAERPPEGQMPSESYLAPRLAHLQEDVLPRAAKLWSEVGGGYVFLGARLSVGEDQASRAALALYDLDREVRRAARILAGRGFINEDSEPILAVRDALDEARTASPRRLLRPASIETGGLRLLRAESGSAHFYLAAYGLVEALLLSDPVQLALTLKSIFGWPARVVLRRFNRDGSEAEAMNLSEFEFEDGDLRLTGRLGEGSELALRYRSPTGTELETTFYG